MSWFRVANERLQYRGRIDRSAFAAWLVTKDGAAAVAALAEQLGFHLFGRSRAARKAIWRELDLTCRTDPFRGALDSAADQYAAAISELAYAPGLPRLTVALRRVVLVPRSMIAGKAHTLLTRHLMRSAGFPAVDEGVRAFFFDTLAREMDAAILREKPAPRRPLRTVQEWACVGLDTEFVWLDAYWSGPGWQGHYVLFEMPPNGLSRKDEKALKAAVAQLNAAVRTLSKQQRQELVRSAGLGAAAT